MYRDCFWNDPVNTTTFQTNRWKYQFTNVPIKSKNGKSQCTGHMKVIAMLQKYNIPNMKPTSKVAAMNFTGLLGKDHLEQALAILQHLLNVTCPVLQLTRYAQSSMQARSHVSFRKFSTYCYTGACTTVRLAWRCCSCSPLWPTCNVPRSVSYILA